MNIKNLEKEYFTNSQYFYMHRSDLLLFTISSDNESEEVSATMALGLMPDQSETKELTANLFWMTNGDWEYFNDDNRYNADELEYWMPKAIRLAVKTALELNPEYKEDLDWFLEWANDAERTLVLDLKIKKVTP